ncbi:MAG: TIGR01906 family membrane protein [Anaerolineae bacterium]
MSSRILTTLIRWAAVLAMPVFIVLLSARVMVNTWYPHYEYAKPDFPPDPYGFTQAQRLELATVCINFLNVPEPPETAVAMLEALRLPGTDRPLFNRYELSHMVDVKRLTDALWRVLTAAGILVAAGSAALLARQQTRRDGYAALFVGGALTTLLLVVLIALILVSWRWFFIAFHDVFFPPGTWTFDWTDSLIRLFPDRFWFDAGVLLVGGALVLGVGVMLAGWVLGQRTRR